ncbi:MAG: hypothetical protein A2Y72_07235 [Chloroflexi bacterium RBG_13_53_26]|nr:MAG: hypothetical protein A2Y72_07235 [Chloroflexi bacterium RBG_13_53_26]
MMVSLVLAGVLCLALPGLASAGITSAQWSETAYNGLDDFYGTTVVAYEAGSTAKLAVSVQNTGVYDITIKSAKVTFDWGEEYSTTDFPSQVKAGDFGIVRFAFTVPSTDVATNMVLHAYEIAVVYEIQNGATAVNWVSWELANDLNLDNDPMVPDSETIYAVSAGVATAVAGSAYTLADYDGEWTWTGAAPAGTIYASYKYTELLFNGDGVRKVGYLTTAPVVAGSEVVCLVNDGAETVTKLDSTAYSIDYATGKITLGTAPSTLQTVRVYYSYYNVWTASGADFAVYSADQLDANQLAGTYDSMYRSATFDSTEGLQLEQEAETLADLGDVEYANGNFAAAEGYYQQAIDTMNEAIAADTSLNTGVEDILIGLGTGAGAWIDSQAAKGDAEATKLEAEADRIAALTDAEANKLNAEAGFADLYGVFLILIGVAGVLAAAGGIVWSVSRLVAARRM